MGIQKSLSIHIMEVILHSMHIRPFRDMHGMIGHLCILKSTLDQEIQLKVTIRPNSLDSSGLVTNKKPLFSVRKSH